MPSRFFISQHRLGKRSVLLQYRAMLAYGFFVLSLFLSTYLIKLSIPAVLGYATNVYAQDLLTYTNELRSKVGLSFLVTNVELEKAAEAKAKHMFENDYWAHTSPSGVEPWDFIVSSGYDYIYAGENLAVDFNNSESVMKAWYDSPSHKENIINDKYTEIGFAVLDGELQGRKTTLIVQMFGKPRGRFLAQANTPTDVVSEEVEELVAEIPESLPIPIETTIESVGAVLNAESVFNASKYLAITIGLFLSLIFAMDGYYVRKYGVFRISGHTIFHVLLLLFAVFGVWYTNIGIVL